MLAPAPEQDLLDRVVVGVQPQARHGAERAVLFSVHAVVEAEGEVLHHGIEVLHLDHVMGAGDHAGGAAAADLCGDDLSVEVLPVLALHLCGRRGFHVAHVSPLFLRGHSQDSPRASLGAKGLSDGPPDASG
jgi:hypothetical protein